MFHYFVSGSRNMFSHSLDPYRSWGLYDMWIAWNTTIWPAAMWEVLAFVGVAGLVKDRNWSKFIVCLSGLAIIGGWFDGVWRSTQAGVWPPDDHLSTAISLIPGVFLISVCLISCLIVYRHSRAK